MGQYPLVLKGHSMIDSHYQGSSTWNVQGTELYPGSIFFLGAWVGKAIVVSRARPFTNREGRKESGQIQYMILFQLPKDLVGGMRKTSRYVTALKQIFSRVHLQSSPRV